MTNGMRADAAAIAEKPCRSCTSFQQWMKNARDGKSKVEPIKETSAVVSPSHIPSEDSPANPKVLDSNSAPVSQKPSGSENSKGAVVVDSNQLNETKQVVVEEVFRSDCPADSESLGRGSWRLLHTMAAAYPKRPSAQQQRDMTQFVGLLSKFYPCPPCAQDFRSWLQQNPPRVASRDELAQFFCVAHNEVNRKLSKPEFDCGLVDQRWRDGWNDGSCG